ncbi:hypothetical protein IG631_16165 [Alternaria alternata]|nr:hypothetical protein IG631_16165 [Alternaria alternata]
MVSRTLRLGASDVACLNYRPCWDVVNAIQANSTAGARSIQNRSTRSPTRRQPYVVKYYINVYPGMTYPYCKSETP